MAIEKSDTNYMVNMYANLASIYVDTKKYDKALTYSQVAYGLNGGQSNSTNAPTNEYRLYLHAPK